MNRLILIFLIVACGLSNLWAQSPEVQDDVPLQQRRVIARVNDAELLQAELNARLRQLPESEDAATIISRQKLLLEALVRQELVLAYLRQRSLGANVKEVQSAFAKWKQELASRAMTPAVYYPRTGMDEPAIRRRIEWQVGWPRFVERKLSDKTLQKYFADHNVEFDGTKLRVAHILWKPSSTRRESRRTAIELREKILAKEITFEEAARKSSQAPTASSGGEIGWIERNKPMHPEFSQAAFELKLGDISNPIETPHGIHLIKCLEIQAGDKPFEDVKEAVKVAARNDMFRTLAARQRKTATVKILRRSRTVNPVERKPYTD